MKVLFTFPGLAHYLSALLGHLQNDEGMQVAAIIPQGKSQSRGEGVHVQTQSNTRTISGEEAIGFLGKPYFKNLPEILAAEQPDILVIGWPYALDLIFNSTLRNTIKKYKIKLIYKGIPFNLPAKNKIKSFYYSEQFTGGEADATGKNFLGFLKFYLITQLRGFYLRMVDAHVYYIDEAIENIASYGVAKEKIFITYNSPDTDTHLAIEAQLHEQKAEHPNLLHVGRLVKWKRVDLLIDAYRKLKEKYPQLSPAAGKAMARISTGVVKISKEKAAVALADKIGNWSYAFKILGVTAISVNLYYNFVNLEDKYRAGELTASEYKEAHELIDLFDKEIVEGKHINGKKTLDENIADLGGLGIALEALKQDQKRLIGL